MPNELTAFWRNDEYTQGLFYGLLARAEQDAYDDDFLMQLAAYREAGGDAAHADIFAAQYLLANGDAENSVTCGERAFRMRPAEPAVWSVLSRAYLEAGRHADALVMQGYALNFFHVPITLDLPASVLTQETLDRLSIAAGKANYAPYALSRMHYSPETGLEAESSVFFAEFLPVSQHITPAYYVAAYAEQEVLGNKHWLMNAMRNTPGLAENVGGDFTFDIMRGTRAPKEAAIHVVQGTEIIVPVIGTAAGQTLRAQTTAVSDVAPLNPDAPNYFRLNEDTALSSEEDFIVGTPIHIGHSHTRRKLVLNILLDALPWEVMGASFADDMPHTSHFFARGTTFHQHFSVHEYTYPSLSTIETGMYLQHTGIFSEWQAIELREEIITIAERARSAGYATSNLVGDAIGIYNGVTRGYDRLVITPYCTFAHDGTERTIRCLEGCGDADHFIFLHLNDIHPWNSGLFQIPAAAQMRLPLVDRLPEAKAHVPSPYLRPSGFYQAAFRQSVRSADRTLGMLFSYIEEHYDPADYLVSLYSDHGVSIFSPNPYIVDAPLTHAAWMMRGAGVPERAVVDDLTSAVDIYPTLCALLGFPVDAPVDGILPRVFGGAGREIAFSNSIFPRKEYFLAARSRDYTLCLETPNVASVSGTIDLQYAKAEIYLRAHEKEAGYEIDDPALRAFFYPRVREFLKGIASNGEAFPPPKESNA